MITPVCFLRVYEPLAAFEGAELLHGQAYATSGRAAAPQVGAAAERVAALRAQVGRPGNWTGLPVVGEEAFVLEQDGVTLVCPWRTELRAGQALVDFREGLPDELADVFTSRPAAVLAEQRLAELGEADPALLRSSIRSSTWSVPLQWFLLVEESERQLDLGPPNRSLRYRTAMSRARRRTARALEVLRRTVPTGYLQASVEDVGRWLEEFHPRSVVELDYGGLVDLLSDDALTSDVSVSDLAAALAALSDDLPDAASVAYARVSERMKALQSVESAS